MVNTENVKEIQVPRFYRPWPHQVAAWHRRDSGKYNFYIQLWARQLGKDIDNLEYAMWRAWNYHGSQSAYVGINNVWIRDNVFKKVIDDAEDGQREFWRDYPENKIDVKETQKEIYMKNNPDGTAPSRIRFIGFLQDSPLVGSSYDNFYFTDTGLLRSGAFDFVQPIWNRKIAAGESLLVNLNGTPRGQKNVFHDIIKTLTGVDNHEEFAGEHRSNVFVDKLTIYDAMIRDKRTGQPTRLYSPEYIEQIKDDMFRQFGNHNLFRQEYLCDFTTVNAGLVYQGIEPLMKEGRCTRYNPDMNRPIYMAWDIANKADEKKKVRDSNAAIIFQYYNGQMFIVDHYESRGMALVECINELRRRDYFHSIQMCILPWDAGLDKTTKSLREELEETFPNIMFHILGQTSVQRGIDMAWRIFPRLVIDSVRNDRVVTCFMQYEFVRNEKTGVWQSPKHTDVSHLMDAFRYACVGINEIDYLKLNNNMTGDDQPWYQATEDEINNNVRATLRKPEKKTWKNDDTIQAY